MASLREIAQAIRDDYESSDYRCSGEQDYQDDGIVLDKVELVLCWTEELSLYDSRPSRSRFM